MRARNWRKLANKRSINRRYKSCWIDYKLTLFLIWTQNLLFLDHFAGKTMVRGRKATEMKFMKYIATTVALVLTATMSMAQSDYRVRAGDVLAIEVLQDPDLNRQALVLNDGRFSFPFAGTLTARGRTIGQIEAAISSAIADNFNAAPDVFVSVTPATNPGTSTASAAPSTIDVFFVGEVGAPGPKSLPKGSTILQALSTSGGFTNFAATKRVQLRRTDSNGLQSVFEINYDALEQGAQLRSDVALQDGDVILVPERRLFE